MEQRFLFLSAIGLTMAVLLGLAIYASLDLVFEPNALATHERRSPGGGSGPGFSLSRFRPGSVVATPTVAARILGHASF
jgi:hypothetical protein